MAACREAPLPQLPSGFDIKRAKVWIERAGNEDQTTGGYDWAAEYDRSRRNRVVTASEALPSKTLQGPERIYV
jgi:hypothetical protein